MKKYFNIAILIVFISISGVFSQVPHIISYQGILTDIDGVALNGNFNIQFSLWNSETAGTAIWQEVQQVTVNNGNFDVYLGIVNPIALPFDIQYWLEIQIGSLLSLPRVMLSSSAYSFISKTVEDNAITSSKIANGSIIGLDISQMGAVTGQTLTWNGTYWNPMFPTLNENDPVFIASAAAGITYSSISNWNSAYGWGNHASAGYLSVSGLTSNYIPKWSGSTLVNGTLFDNGSIGIGTTSPLAKFHVNNGSILFDGTTGDTPVSGYGTRLMWIPAKGAFRAGYASSESWNDANIGINSVAMGFGTIASGYISTAFGSYNIASGGISTALGSNTIASGEWSTATGDYTTASGYYSIAMGRSTTASGWNSFATGYETEANGMLSTTLGMYTTASGSYSTAAGSYTTAQPHSSFVIGRYNIVSGTINDWIDTEPLFIIGNGSSGSNRSNAMTVLKNGNVGIGIVQPTNKLDVDGVITATGGNSNNWNIAYGWGNHASAGYLSVSGLTSNYIPKWNGSTLVNGTLFDNGSIGIGTTSPLAKFQVNNGSVAFTGTTGGTPISGAGTRFMWIPAKGALRGGNAGTTAWDDANIGTNSTAFGSGTTASGYRSTAFGLTTTASNDETVAMGWNTTASGETSLASGYNTTASGNFSTAMGAYTTAQAFASMAVGRHNVVAGNMTSWANADPLFVIGNGTSSTSKNNALTVLKNGNTGINTYAPVSAFQVENGTVLFNGTTGETPVTGVGTRFMWIPSKMAIRAGFVSGTQWNDDNIGSGSAAFGYNNTASGDNTFASGQNNIASGDRSFASGLNTTASGYESTAMGFYTTASGGGSTSFGSLTTASGSESTAMGYATTASGNFSTSMGASTTASGNYSTAMGYATTASGSRSVTMGDETTASGIGSVAMGVGTTAQAYASLVLGRYNVISGTYNSWTATEPVFVIGNGTSDISRNNAFTVIKNGNTGISRLPATNKLEVEGTASKSTAGDWLSNSDRRIKTDILDIDNSIDLLMKLRPVKFRYTPEYIKLHPFIENKYYYNFIAQEFQQVFPESVKGSGELLNGTNQEILQIDTYNSQIITIKAVQELVKENKELNKKIDELQNELVKIKQLLQNIDSKK